METDTTSITKFLWIVPEMSVDPNPDLMKYLQSVEELDLQKLSDFIKVDFGQSVDPIMKVDFGVVFHQMCYFDSDNEYDLDKPVFIFKHLDSPKMSYITKAYLKFVLTEEFLSKIKKCHNYNMSHFALKVSGTSEQWKKMEELLIDDGNGLKLFMKVLKRFPLEIKNIFKS